MKCFSIDESGYTGYDLLNTDQRFQGSTALSIPDDEARRLISYFFPRLQADELKFGTCARRPAYRKPLMELQREVLKNHSCVTSVCDKRFVLTLKFLDYAVEPYYFERGYDFYADGQNVAYASLLYVTGPTLLGQSEFEALLHAFQTAVRVKTKASIDRLQLIARSIVVPDLIEGLGPLCIGSQECVDAICNPRVTTDAALAVLLSLIHRTEVLTTEAYRVEHDQSKNLLTYNDYLTKLIGHQHTVEFELTRDTQLKFPLKLQSVTQVDSKASSSVQIADVMIGAALDATRGLASNGKSLLNPDEVFELYGDEQLIHLVPSINFEEEHTFRANSQASELVEYLARHIESHTA